MMWMAATALLISAAISFDRWARNGPPVQDPFAIGTLVLIAIGVSGALCAVVCGLTWRLQGRAFPTEPGQWLLLEIALLVLGLVIWVAGSFVMLWINDDLIEPFQLVWGVLVAITFACTYIYVGWKRCDTRAWQIAVLSIAAMPVLAPVLFLWAVIKDFRNQNVRHWTHWFGITVFLVFIAIIVVAILRDEYF